MSSQVITVCQICWKMSSHKTAPTLTPADKIKKDKNDKQICQVCSLQWSPVQLVKSNGKWVYIRPRPANVPGEFKMCDKKGKCMRGASCTFAHNREELESWNKEREGPPMPDNPRAAPPISGNRYMMCTHHSNGKRCLYGAECKFAHSQEELDSWNSTINTRHMGEGSTSRTSSICLDTTPPDYKYLGSPNVLDKKPEDKQRIIPGLPVTKSNNRTRLSSMSSNTSNTSDLGSKPLPVSLTMHNAMRTTSTPEVYRCDICDCTCTSKKQLKEHKAGAKHKQIARSTSAPEEPLIRECPNLSSKGAREYVICKSVEDSGRCSYGNGCPAAHSYEELEVWNSQLNKSIQGMLPSLDNVVPFLDKIRRELDNTDLIISDLLQPKNGISLEEVSGTRLQIDHTADTPLTWIFRVTVRCDCQLLGMIMLGEQYPQFKFTSLIISTTPILPTVSPYAIESKHVLYPGDSFTVQVEFSHQVGCFPQVIVLKFNGFFMGSLLQVTCMSSESFDLQNEQKQTTVSQSTTNTTADWGTTIKVIPLPNVAESERDQCPNEYTANIDRGVILSQSLTMANYKQQLHSLLFLEELDRQSLLANSHLPNMACVISPGYKDQYMFHCAPQGYAYITFALDDLNNSSLQLIGRNKICEVKPLTANVAYQGILELFGREKLVVRVAEDCAQKCENSTASVRFTQRRKWFKYMHYAVDQVDLGLLFPNYSPPSRSTKPDELELLLNKTNLNAAQRGVIEDILDPYASHIPTLVYGPFGTGKTSTLVEAVSILLQVNVMSRILVCTHSNSAANIYIERLDKKFGSEFLKGKILRHYYYQRKVDSIKPLIMKYTNRVENSFELPSLATLRELALVVTTIEQSGDLAFCGLESGHFTHIFIDEAAQVMEAQALIPLQLAVLKRQNSTKIVLAGDHMQMEQELVSKKAKMVGLHRSLLERLISCPLYATEEGRTCCTQLIHNYRTHPVILHLPSVLFYENNLIPMVETTADSPREPLSFYGVQGQESKDDLSFSYENFIEARAVEERAKDLTDKGLDASEICVLTPYTRQCKIIRYLLRRSGLAKVTVDTTQGVQGREFRALIVSTVRTCRTEPGEDEEETSFINNPKLFNMAITRAKDWLIIVGEPYTLCTVGPNRTCWERLVRYCIQFDSFHFPNIQEFLTVLSRPIVSKFPAISGVAQKQEEPLSDYTDTERKQFFRQKLLPIIQQMCPQHAIKITTVLVEMNTQKMIELFASGNSELQKKVKATLEFLGVEEPSPSSVPKYLTRQLECLNEHELLIQNCITRPQQAPNLPARRILHEQLNIIRDQKIRLNNQYQLLQQLNSCLPMRSMVLPNGGGLTSPTSQNSGVIMPQNSGAIMPQNSGAIMPQNSGAIMPQNSGSVIMSGAQSSGSSILTQNSVILPQNIGIVPQSSSIMPGAQLHGQVSSNNHRSPATPPTFASNPNIVPLNKPLVSPSNSLIAPNSPLLTPGFSSFQTGTFNNNNHSGPPPGWSFGGGSSGSAFSHVPNNNNRTSPMSTSIFPNEPPVVNSVIGAPLYNSSTISQSVYNSSTTSQPVYNSNTTSQPAYNSNTTSQPVYNSYSPAPGQLFNSSSSSIFNSNESDSPGATISPAITTSSSMLRGLGAIGERHF